VNSLEGPVERGLIRKSTLCGDIGKGLAGVRHEVLGPIHTAFDQPPVRRPAKGHFEGPGKVAYGQFACFCNLPEGNITVQMSLQ